MLGNIRLACCVAGGMNLVPKEEDVLEVGGVCVLRAEMRPKLQTVYVEGGGG
jgi:hypothetical protein